MVQQGLENVPCQVEKAISLIGNKWSLFIIKELHFKAQSMRFNELLRALKPISSRTLSLKLKELLKYEIIEKNVVSTSPPHSEYNLTERGEELTTVLTAMAEWNYKWYSTEDKNV